MGITAFAWILSLLLGCVAAVVILLSMPDPNLLDDANDPINSRARRNRGILLKLFYPLIAVIAQLMALIPLKKKRKELEKKLTQAGRPGGLTVDEYNASRVITVFFAVLAGLFFDTELDFMPLCTLGLGVLGLMYPDIWLNDTVAKRRRRIFRQLPEVLDTLRLATDAGFDLSSALTAVVEQGRDGPLQEELELVDREVSLGRTRQQAFRNFADRIAMPEVNAFVLALIQADQLGASIGPVLKAQADMARSRRWALAETLVNKMPMKMLGPLVVFIFPSSFVILFTPLLIQWMQGGT